MKRITWTIGLLALLALAGSAAAVDFWQGPPPGTWVRGGPGTTFEHWMFSEPVVDLPEIFDNPYGPPLADVDPANFEWGTWECPPELDPRGFVEGFHCINPDGGVIILHIPNTETVAGAKSIFLQITSSKAPTDVSVFGMGTTPPYTSGSWNTGLPQIQWPGPAPFGGVWYTYNYGRVIRPNPQMEDIVIEVPYCTVIDQIVVDTICSPDPVGDESTSWSDVKALFR